MDSKLSALSSGSAIQDSDLFYSDQSGSSVKQNAASFKTYFKSSGAIRAVLSGNTTFNVSGSGSDLTGDGSAGNPWATPQHAMNVLGMYDFAGFQATVQHANGTYPCPQITSFPVGAFNFAGGNSIIFMGNASDNTAVTWTDTGSNTDGFSCLDTECPCDIQIDHITIAPSGANVWPLTVDSNWSLISYTNCRFVAPVGGSSVGCIFFNPMSTAFFDTIEVVGNWGYFVKTDINGPFNQVGFIGAWTMTGTPAFSDAFVHLSMQSQAFLTRFSFTGSATGSRYAIAQNSALNTNGGGVLALPGNVAGSIQTGASYDNNIFTVSTLPSASNSEGAEIIVTDSNQTTTAGIGAIVATGGANIVPVYSDGTNWRIG